MRIARYNEGRIGVVRGEVIVDVTDLAGVTPGDWPDVGPVRMINQFAEVRPRLEAAAASGPGIPLTDVTLRTPLPWPNKVIAYPVNYHAHGKEMSAGYRADVQGFFLKPSSSLSGAGEPVVLPDLDGREVHHESELAIIIGKTVRNVGPDEAMDAIFGYACLLDMVVRGREERVFRKAYDTFCPVGPWITTRDEVPDPAALSMRLTVNGGLRQSANTRDLVLDIPGMVEMAAAVMTLYPGDIIATGTPEGVGPVSAGDVIDISIDRLGAMRVPVVQGQGGRAKPFLTPFVPQIVKQ